MLKKLTSNHLVMILAAAAVLYVLANYSSGKGTILSGMVNQNGGEQMKMNFDITFDDFSTKNIRIYKTSNSENYTAEVNKKKYREINVNTLQIDPEAVTLK